MKLHSLFAVFLSLLLAGAASAADRIQTRSDGSKSGRITAMSPIVVQIDVRGVPEKIQVNEIVNIRFDEEPDALTDARMLIRSGDFFEAMKDLKEINVGSIPKDSPILGDVQFYFAYCFAQRALGGAESLKDAYDYMKKFVGGNPGNYHFFEAQEMLGDLLVAAGRPDYAAKHYDEAEKAPWPDSKLRIALARARAFQAEGKHAQAIAEFEKVLGNSLQGEQADRSRLAAKLGKAASLARTRQGDEGLKLVNAVIKAAQKGDTEIHARAYNALGDCYMAMGDNKSAVMAYLHIDALYYQHPPIHAESLARVAGLWTRLDKKDRSAAALKKLNSMYPQSKWAKTGS